MIKKILLGVLVTGLVGVLVWGAVIRTSAKTEQVAEASSTDHAGTGNGPSQALGEQGQGRNARTLASEDLEVERQGRNQAVTADLDAQRQGRNQVEATELSSSQGGGRNGQSERQSSNRVATAVEWIVYEGQIVQAPESGVDLMLELPDGEELVVGAGPIYEIEPDFFHVGDSIQVSGYWEGEEFKAAEITRTSDGKVVTLRDEYGRPAWAGSDGRQGQQADGAGEAEVTEWLDLEAVVTGVDADALVLQTPSGEKLIVEGRAWSFIQELGFWAEVDDELLVSGFYEGADFEVGGLTDLTSGAAVTVREATGRPLWAGGGFGGRGGNGL